MKNNLKNPLKTRKLPKHETKLINHN